MRTRGSLLMLALLAGCPAKAPAPTTPASGPVAPAAGDPPPASGERTPITEFALDGNVLKLPQPITFANDGDTLDEAASLPALWYVHDYLAAKPYVTLVRIEGHDTLDGQDALMMTGERALAVGRWLVAHGIDCKRMLVAAFGNTKPIADRAGPDRANNRRIDFVNAELRGRAIGGMPTDGSAPAAAPVCDE